MEVHHGFIIHLRGDESKDSFFVGLDPFGLASLIMFVDMFTSTSKFEESCSVGDSQWLQDRLESESAEGFISCRIHPGSGAALTTLADMSASVIECVKVARERSRSIRLMVRFHNYISISEQVHIINVGDIC
jgi:hypothetical protein